MNEPMNATLPNATNIDPVQALRRRWLSALAQADGEQLRQALDGEADAPTWRRLRATDVGLAMVRGRMGGDGDAFNFGELTMARAAIVTDSGVAGFGWVQGRDMAKAERVAVLDALLQDEARRDRLMADLIEPIERGLAARKAQRAEDVAASRVEFFTMVRGD
jgi:alpha-D-ribose 1-methylphosphonate 5-triphosphate synthase subunit PhnG